jgi:hypothetical protein
MTDYKNRRYEEPTPIEAKIVHGSAFIAVLLALIVWL